MFKSGNITFNLILDMSLQLVVQTSKKYNKSGIDNYVELRKNGKKNHDQAVNELERNLSFLRPKDI